MSISKVESDFHPCKKGNQGILKTLQAYLSRNKIGEILVLQGLITSSELRRALHEQKETRIPLGQVLLKHNVISRKQLAFILARQRSVRLMAGFFMCFMSVTSLSKRAAAEIADVPAKVSLASLDTSIQGLGDVDYYPALFGSDEKRSNNLKAFTKWSDMFKRFDAALKTSNGQKVIYKLKSDLEVLKNLPLSQMADKVNAMMNKKKYIVDSRNWGKSDYWATPVEFLKNGGDCEDFAIAKYVSLRALGVSEERLRIAIVHDNEKNIPHAILIVYTDQGAMVLDNQNKDMRTAESLTSRYKPIFSINRQAWWLHTSPESTSTVVASAN